MNPAFVYIVGTAIAVALAVSAVFQIRVIIQMQGLIKRLEGTAQYLEASRPQIDRILSGLEAQLAELRGISEKANRIAGSAESVTSDLRVAVQPIITQVSDLAQTVHHLRAATVAARAGFSAFRAYRQADSDESGAPIEHDDER